MQAHVVKEHERCVGLFVPEQFLLVTVDNRKLSIAYMHMQQVQVPPTRKATKMEGFQAEEGRTKSLERAESVINVLRMHGAGDPVPVQEIADQTNSYYEEILHVVSALEALGIVRRYKRVGAPREGARVAYSLEDPKNIREARSKLGLESRARTRGSDSGGRSRRRTAA